MIRIRVHPDPAGTSQSARQADFHCDYQQDPSAFISHRKTLGAATVDAGMHQILQQAGQGLDRLSLGHESIWQIEPLAILRLARIAGVKEKKGHGAFGIQTPLNATSTTRFLGLPLSSDDSKD